MWFKNLRLYRLTKPFNLSPEALHERLTERSSRSCGSLEPFTYGWTPPLGRNSELLTHAANGCIMVCGRKEEKVLPAAVVREMLDEKIAAIEAEQARTVRRKEKEEMRQEVLLDLLPKAFSKSSLTHAYIDPGKGWLVVDAASAARAEELVSLLRETLGSLPAIPPAVRNAPSDVLTNWLKGQAVPGDFLVEDQCELRDPDEEGGVVRCIRQDLASDEIQSHLKAGKRVTRLAVQWREHLGCILSDDLSIKRLRFLDLIQEAAADMEADDEASRFDADFSLMTLELSRFIPALMKAFGGEDESAPG
ncbi:MAG TPA: recombination-associated protein RdgC [Sedimenticola sp.]|nr:recombination-associated protein RdgC [Sedimenticola sp.]